MVAGGRSATEADLHGGPSNLRETIPFVPEESRQWYRSWKCRRMGWGWGVWLSARVGKCFLWIYFFREKNKALWSVLESGRNKAWDIWNWTFLLTGSTELLPKFSYLETVELQYQMQRESFFKETVAQHPAGIWKSFHWQMIMDFILSFARNPYTIGYSEEKAFSSHMHARGRKQTTKASFPKLNAGPCKISPLPAPVKQSWWRLLSVNLFVCIKEVWSVLHVTLVINNRGYIHLYLSLMGNIWAKKKRLARPTLNARDGGRREYLQLALILATLLDGQA